MRARSAGQALALEHNGASANGKKSKLLDCRSEDGDDLFLHRRGNVHQTGIVGHNDVAEFHCGSRLEKSERSAHVRRTLLPARFVDCSHDPIAYRLVRDTTEDQDFCIIFRCEPAPEFGESFLRPTLGFVFRRRAHADDLLIAIKFQRRHFSDNSKHHFIRNIKLKSFSIVLNPKRFERLYIPIGHGRSRPVEVFFELHKHRTCDDALIDRQHIAGACTESKIPAAQAAVNIEDEIVSLSADFFFKMFQAAEAERRIELESKIYVTVISDEFRIFFSRYDIYL